MGQADRLATEKAALEDRLDHLTRKIAYLEEARLVASPGEKFDLSEQIRRLCKEKIAVDRELEEVERVVVGDRIFRWLDCLNFLAEVARFNEMIASNGLRGAFVINGPEKHGQKWLLNRLIRRINEIQPTEPIRFDLTAIGRSTQMDDIWRRLASHTKPRAAGQPDREAIARAVALLCRARPVILIFSSPLVPEFLDAFVQELWCVLDRAAAAVPDRRFPLLAFVVDYAEILRPRPDQDMPVSLRIAKPFSREQLEAWLHAEGIGLWPAAQGCAKSLVDELHQGCGGVPELVFERFCELFGHNWYAQETRWQPY